MATNNALNTPNITLCGTFTTTGGAYSLTATLTGNTNVTFPTSGTLATMSSLPIGGYQNTFLLMGG